jgi:hypothetical protein
MPGALAPDPRPVDTDLLHCFSSPWSATPSRGAMAGSLALLAWLFSGTVRIRTAVARHPKVAAGWSFAVRQPVTRRCYRAG